MMALRVLIFISIAVSPVIVSSGFAQEKKKSEPQVRIRILEEIKDADVRQEKEAELAEILKLIEETIDTQSDFGNSVALRQVMREFHKAVDKESAKAKELLPKLEEHIGLQFDSFCTQLEPAAADDKALSDQLKRLRQSRDDFVEARTELLRYAAEGEAAPEMLADVFQDLCRDLEIQVGLDHALRLGAPHPDLAVVTLNMPGLDCGGCAKMIEQTLTNLGVQSFEKNVAERKCRFVVPRDFDIEAKLNELSESVKQFENWKFAR